VVLKQVCVIQHNPIETLGLAESVLAENGYEYKYVKVFANEEVPKCLDGICALIILGGPMGLRDTDKFPFLKDEMRLIEQALQADLPVFGICLGSQLLAAVLGGDVYQSNHSEFGWYPLSWEDSCTVDSVFHRCHEQSTVYLWHNDIFELPVGAVSLARTEATKCQAFRYGNRAYGLLFHLEVTRDIINQMTTQLRDELLANQVDPLQLLQDTNQFLPASTELGREIFSQWVALIQ
jgi:GMP synthase (glutamine-hydrolysing)